MAMNPSLSLVPFMKLEDASRGFGACHRVYVSVSDNQKKENRTGRTRVCDAPARRSAARQTMTAGTGQARARRRARARARARMAAQARRKVLLLTAVMMILMVSCFLMGLKARPAEEGPKTVKYFTTVTVGYNDTMDDLVSRYMDQDHYKNPEAYISEVLKINHIVLKPGQTLKVRPGDQLVIPYYGLDE